MAYKGMDDAQLEASANQLSTMARSLDALVIRCDVLVGQVSNTWHGQDSQAFRDEWNSTHRRSLTRVTAEVHGMVDLLRRNIAAQRDTSQRLDGGGSVGGLQANSGGPSHGSDRLPGGPNAGADAEMFTRFMALVNAPGQVFTASDWGMHGVAGVLSAIHPGLDAGPLTSAFRPLGELGAMRAYGSVTAGISAVSNTLYAHRELADGLSSGDVDLQLRGVYDATEAVINGVAAIPFPPSQAVFGGAALAMELGQQAYDSVPVVKQTWDTAVVGPIKFIGDSAAGLIWDGCIAPIQAMRGK